LALPLPFAGAGAVFFAFFFDFSLCFAICALLVGCREMSRPDAPD
jgi:hypothetical protein